MIATGLISIDCFSSQSPPCPARRLPASSGLRQFSCEAPAGLIVHSDRGSLGASAVHQALLVKHGLIGGMSRKGNCWDTQSNISLSAAFGLTRAGIGVMPLR